MANILAKITNKIVNGAAVSKLSLSYDELSKAVQTAQKASNSWSKSMAATLSACSGASVSFGNMANALNSLAQGYNDFDKAMRAVNTMAGKDSAGLGVLKGQVNELAKSIPLAKSALADGLYQVISNGVPEDNWISYLEASAKASVGGIADLGQTVTVTSTIIKNYGLEWSAAAEIQDKIQTTAKNGVTSFEQLAQALPRVTGNAATLGVSIDELMATFATLTGVSGNTAEVSTQLAAIFTALIKPSSEATKMAEKMGIQFDATAIQAAGGFDMFLKSLDIAVKDYSAASGVLEQEVYGKLFGSAESLRALVPLQGELAEKFTENVAAMQNSAGTIEQAFSEMGSTGESQMQKIKNSISIVSDSLGKLASYVAPCASLLAQFGQSAIGIVAVCNAAGKFSKAIKGCTIAAKALGMAMKGILGGGAVIGVIYALCKAFDYFSSSSKKAADSLNEAGGALERANSAFEQTSQQVQIEIQKELSELKKLIVTKGDATKMVETLNQKYKDSFGTYATAAEWYKVLAKNAAAYAKAQGAAAKGVELSATLSDLELERDQLVKKQQELLHKGDVEIKRYGRNGSRKKVTGSDADSYIQLGKAIKAVEDRIKNVNAFISANEREVERYTSLIQKVDTAESPTAPESSGDNKENKKTQKQWIENAKTLEQYSNNLQVLDAKLRALDPSQIEEVARLRAQRQEIERQITALQILLGLKGATVRHSLDAPKELNIPTSQKSFAPEPPSVRPADLQLSSGVYEMAADSMNKYTAAVSAAAKQNQLLQGSVANIGSAMGSLGQAIGGAAGAWLEYAANTLSAVSAVLPQILALTNAKFGQAMAEATSSSAGLPFPFNIISIGAGVAAVIAAMAKVPKFADGGIAYGPTLGLFGEYAGASSNPEVVAPLSELSKLLQPAVPVAGGEVRVRIAGRDLVGVLDLQRNYNSRI